MVLPFIVQKRFCRRGAGGMPALSAWRHRESFGRQGVERLDRCWNSEIGCWAHWPSLFLSIFATSGEMGARERINNDIYHHYGDAWYTAKDDPVAILRAETRTKLPWLIEKMEQYLGPGPKSVLDVGCGGGFVSNPLSELGHLVTGLDAAADSLAVARRFDRSKRTRYLQGDAYALPFEAESFDVVTEMDLLEHLEDPARAVAEAARVLKPGGLYLAQTISRSWLAWLVAIKVVEWLVPKTPERMHLLRLFIRPRELQVYAEAAGLSCEEILGMCPKLSTIPWLRLGSGEVPDTLAFTRTRFPWLSYMGCFRKRSRL